MVAPCRRAEGMGLPEKGVQISRRWSVARETVRPSRCGSSEAAETFDFGGVRAWERWTIDGETATLFSQGLEEVLEQGHGFIGENTGNGRDAVVEARVFGQAHQRAHGPGLWVARAIDHAAQAGVDDEAGALFMGRKLEGDGEGAIGQAPVFERARGGDDGKVLGMGGGVFVGLAPVVAEKPSPRTWPVCVL